MATAERATEVGSAPIADREYVAIDLRGVSWKLRADLATAVLPHLQSAVLGLELDGAVETVKSGPHRTVYRLHTPAGEFYLKHFRTNAWKGLVQTLVRQSKAEREASVARRIAALGLPTFEPIALGSIRRHGLLADSFLASRGIPNSLPLDEFVATHFLAEPEVSSGRHAKLRQALATAIGELCARLHLAGVEHADFHAANILVRQEPDGRPRLWLIDLHPVNFHGELSDRTRYRNLAYLHQFFVGKSTRADRLRFYRAYQKAWRQREARGGIKSTETCRAIESTLDRQEIATLESSLTQGAFRGWQRADRAWRRGNRHVKKLAGPAGDCRGLAALDRQWLDNLRDDPEQLFRGDSVIWHKQAARHRVAEVQLPDELAHVAKRAFYKCIESREGWRSWLARVRELPVRKAWEFGHALLRRNIDTPKPILCLERTPSQPGRSYLLTEAIPQTRSAADFLGRDWLGLSQVEQRCWLLARARRLAWQMRRLHESAFDHRDLKFANLLVSTELEDPRIWFLDLDGMRVWRHLPQQRMVQNLARIQVSAQSHALGTRSDRVRFLKWYLGPERAHQWKDWWRRIDSTSVRKLARNNRRGRPIH
jgi:tRNA A-37 threonylcarbamoyl transferase component Bud32